MDVSHHDDAAPQEHTVDLGTTEIRIDEQGNLKTADQAKLAAQPMVPVQPAPPLPPISPALPVAAENPASPIHVEPYQAPISAPPKPIDPQLNRHAFMNQAPPAGTDPTAAETTTNPFSPDQADPYGSPPQGAGKPSIDEVFHTKDIQPPSQIPTPVTGPLDQARGAVENALAGAPYNPAVEGPVQALNAQPLEPTSDTPSLELPAAPVPAQPAPPPVPPPLVGTLPTPPLQ